MRIMGGPNMCRSRFWSGVLILTPFLVLSTAGQSKSAAKGEVDKGLICLARGDFDGAIENFTRAIDIGSHHEARSGSGESANLKLKMNSGNSTSGEVTFIDPLTATAYSNRGVAWVHKGDLDR